MATETGTDREIEQPLEARPLSAAAQRALAEAQARRLLAEAQLEERPQEFNGPAGPEPVRYGDWERKGIASDF
jgi:hypothetical protein